MLLNKSEITKFYKSVEKKFTKWAKTQDHIRLAYVVGSYARTDMPADKWSDLDIIVFSTDPQRLIESTEWVSKFGTPVITFVEPIAVNPHYTSPVCWNWKPDCLRKSCQ